MLAAQVKEVEMGNADPSTLNVMPLDDRRYGALRVIVQRKNGVELAERCLKAGADPDFNDEVGIALDCAGSKEAVALLLKYAADPKKSRRCLNAVLTHFFLYGPHRHEKSYRTSLQETFDVLELLLQNGADIHAIPHPLKKIANTVNAYQNDKKALLSFFLHHGSNPNDNDVVLYQSVYEELRCQPWAEDFIRKERGWLLAKPLLVAINKDQKDDCHIQKLPQEIIQNILKRIGIVNKKNSGNKDDRGL